MKALLLAGLLLAAPCAQAQWGTVLDPNIIRQAAEAATTGNITLNNVQIDGAPAYQAPMPTAQEIAAEIRAQERSAQLSKQAAEREARRARIGKVVEQAYRAEFRK